MNNKHNLRALLTELFQFHLSMPESREKHKLDQIISMMNVGNVSLKKILLAINSNLENEKSNKNITLKEKNIILWNHVLSIFTKYLKG